MNVIAQVLMMISSFIRIYSLLLVIRVFLTWIPSLNYSTVGTVLSQLCDPFLNFFRRIRFLQIGMLDFSPIVAIFTLTLVEQAVNSIIVTGQFSLISILGIIFLSVFGLASQFGIFLVVLLIARLLMDIFSWGNRQFLGGIDSFLTGVYGKITYKFAKLRFVGFRYKLIVMIVLSLLILWILNFLKTFVIRFMI